MDSCYLCGEHFNESSVIKHREHIIQQALGGTLTENEILCEECGNKLGEIIDAPFNKIFDNICPQLDIRKHRKNNRSKPAKGVIISDNDKYGNDLRGVEVLWREGKVAPIKPMRIYTADSAKVIVYSEKKNLKNYLKKVEKEISEKFPCGSRPELIVCTDIDGLIEYRLEIDNEVFKKGIAKIAIGFAAKAGVDRRYLDLALDLDSKEIKKDVPLIQFYPMSYFDKIIEKHKREIRYYPAHTLILFTAPRNNRILVCYVELLSTFQWYVILSESYDGPPVYQCYTQRIDKVEDYVFEPGRRYHKERSAILSSLNITQEEIEDAYERQKNQSLGLTIHEVEIELIRKKYIERKYQVFFDEEVKAAIDFALQKSRNSKKSGEKSLREMSDLIKNMRLFYNSHDDEEIFNSSHYRRGYMFDGEYHDSVLSLTCFYGLPAGRQALKEYGHKKVYMLYEYIEQKNINNKINS